MRKVAYLLDREDDFVVLANEGKAELLTDAYDEADETIPDEVTGDAYIGAVMCILGKYAPEAEYVPLERVM